MKRIYLDYGATTPVDPSVADAMSDVSRGIYGNPSSLHAEGRAAARLVAEARREVSALIGCGEDEVVFTGSGSESNNLAIKGVAAQHSPNAAHFITTRVEHPSVLKTFEWLEHGGYGVTYLDTDRCGIPSVEALRAAIRDETRLVSVMRANNETGALLPVKELAAAAKERGVLFHTDAVQAVGKIPVDVKDLGVDLLSLAGHKFYAPKGVGALYVRKGVKLESLVHGGGQESGRRAGTENLVGMAGIGKASAIARESLPAEGVRLRVLSASLKARLAASYEILFHGDDSNCLPNTVCVAFKGMSGESLLMALDLEGVAISAGSACASGALKPSHVLTAMGLDEETMRSTVRITLGRWTDEEEIDRFLDILSIVMGRLGASSRSR